MTLLDNSGDNILLREREGESSGDIYDLTQREDSTTEVKVAIKQTSQSIDDPDEYDIFNITPAAQEHLDKEENQSQKRQLDALLDMIKNAVIGYSPNLPGIRISLSGDDSITLVWRTGPAYFGVSIFNDENDSAWTLITGRGDARGYNSDGYLNDPDFKFQLPILFELFRRYQDR